MSLRRFLGGTALVGLAVACRTSTSTNGTEATDAAQLLKTDREWASLAGEGKNADTVVSYWTDDARVLLPGAPVISGKAAIREMVAGMLKTPGFHITWTPDSAVVSRTGDLGYTYGTNDVTAPDSTGKLITTHARYITVWRRGADGRWRCVQDYSDPGPA